MGNYIRIAVLGPPKAGKTSLANRLSLKAVTGEYVASQVNETYYFKKDEKQFAFQVMQGGRAWDWGTAKRTQGMIYVIDCSWEQPESEEFEQKFNTAKAGLQIALSKITKGPVLILANKWDKVPSDITKEHIEKLLDFETTTSSQFKSPQVEIKLYTSAIFSPVSNYELNEGLDWFCSKF